MNRKILFFLLTFINYIVCYSQHRGNNWIFGDSILIAFNGSASPVIGSMPSDGREAVAAISDSAGNLLFYGGSRWQFGTDCYYTFLYNRLGEYMLNSTGLYGHCSATQGALILPLPGSSTLYYVFVNGIAGGPGNSPKLDYNIIDMQLDSGNGAVSTVNLVLCDSILSEQLNAVKHANGRDWWIVTHTRSTSDYLIYLFTPSGISGPIIQSLGNSINSIRDVAGELVFSQQGDKMCHAFASGKIQLFDFDRCTGLLSNLLQLGTNDTIQGYYGVSFSPSGERLYVSTWGDSLFQFDLTSTNVLGSKQLLYVIPNFEIDFCQHQLAEDAKIYISCYSFQTNSDTLSYLSVIESPDSLGLACTFIPFTIDLNDRYTSLGLPNIPNLNLGPIVGSICDSLITEANEVFADELVQLYPNPANNKIILRMKEDNCLSIVITILNPLGQIIQPPIECKKQKAVELNVDELIPGYYYVNIASNNLNRIMKFVKVN